jgi:hypothetical protein
MKTKPAQVQAGDVVHRRPGTGHDLCDYTANVEYLEIVSPGLQNRRHAAGHRQGAR